MIEVIEYSGIILWLIYLILLAKREISCKNKYGKEYTKQLIVKKPFHLIRIDSLFFLIVYLIYTNFADSRVLPYLYLIIVLTNIVYVLYDISDNYKDIKISFKKECIYYLGIIILAIIPILYMAITNNLFNACTITLILNLFVPIYIWLVKIFKNN